MRSSRNEGEGKESDGAGLSVGEFVEARPNLMDGGKEERLRGRSRGVPRHLVGSADDVEDASMGGRADDSVRVLHAVSWDLVGSEVRGTSGNTS